MSDANYWSGLRRRRLSRRRLMAAGSVAGAGIAAGALVGCGDDDDEEPVPAGTSAPATSGQPKRGGTFAAATTINPPNFDVHAVNTQFLAAWGPGLVYSRLISLDTGPDGLAKSNAIPRPDVAEKWEQPDDRTYIFTLRKGVKFFNIAPVNGRELVAEDVVYSFNRQREQRANAVYVGPMDRVQAVDPYTVRLQLTRPNSDQLIDLAESHNKIVARERVDRTGDLKDQPVIGSGAFMLKEYLPNQIQRYERNPDYFLKDQPYVDGFDIHFIADRSTFLAALRTGRVQTSGPGGTTDIKRDEIRLIRTDVPDMVFVERKNWSGNFLWAHTGKPPTNDIRVRQALSKALDRRLIIDTAFNGAGWISPTIKLPNERALLPEAELNRLLARDVAGARQLLQQAGVTNWTPKLGTGTSAPELGEVVQAQLKDVGINATIELIDIARLTERVYKGEFEIYAGGSGVGASTNGDLDARWHTGGSINAPQLSDPELDRLIEQQAAEVRSEERRFELLKQIQRRIIEVAATIPIMSDFEIGAHRPSLKGEWLPNLPSDFYEYQTLQRVWIDR